MEFPPVFLWVGDPFLTAERYDKFLADLTPQAGGAISEQRFRLSETSLEDILPAARNQTFFSSFQVFRILEADCLEESDVEFLKIFLSTPLSSTCLVFEAEKIEKASPLLDVIGKFGKIESLDEGGKKTAGNKMIWERLRKSGKKISPDALQKLEDQGEGSPGFLESVLDQLINYVGEAPEITGSMVEAFQEDWKEPNVFALTDAIASGKGGEALLLSRQILAGDEKELIPMLGLLHWQIRRFWQARVLLDEGLSQEIIFKKCKVSPRQGPFFMRQLQQLTRHKLEKALEGLFQLDRNVKTGNAEGLPELECWIAGMTK